MESCNNKSRVSFFTIDAPAGEVYYPRVQLNTNLASLASRLFFTLA